jgi:hypothetical protein
MLAGELFRNHSPLKDGSRIILNFLKMKKLFMLLFSIIIFSIFYISCENSTFSDKQIIKDSTLQNRNDTAIVGQSCLENPNPENCDTGIYNWFITLPQYPECTFDVSLVYYKCVGFEAVAIHVGEFDIEPVDNGLPNDCTQYYDDINDKYADSTIVEFIIEFNQSVWREVTKNILASFSNTNTQYIEIEYNIGACKYLCYITELDCGTSCCRRINIFKKINGEWIVEEGEIEHYGEDCPINPVSYCPVDVLQTGECYDNCESLDF